MSGADKNEDFSKALLGARLEIQSRNEAPGGLDPIIAKGTALIKDLDRERAAAPNDNYYLELRVKAGMNQLNAFVHARDAQGGLWFSKDTMKELSALMAIKPSLVQDKQFQQYAKMANALADPEFKRQFENHGGIE